MVIRNIRFFPVKRSVHNEYLTGNSLELKRWTDFITRAWRVYWPDRSKYHVVSAVLAPSFVHSFPLFFFSMHSHPGWQVQAHGCYDSLSEYIHNTLSLSFSVPLQEIVLFMLSLRLLYFSVPLLLLIHHLLIVCFTSVPLVSNINSHPSIRITTATSVSFCSSYLSCLSFPFSLLRSFIPSVFGG